jgi:hypothetical protein
MRVLVVCFGSVNQPYDTHTDESAVLDGLKGSRLIRFTRGLGPLRPGSRKGCTC